MKNTRRLIYQRSKRSQSKQMLFVYFWTTIAMQCFATVIFFLLLISHWLPLAYVLVLLEALVFPAWSYMHIRAFAEKAISHSDLNTFLPLDEMYALNPFDFEEHVACLFRKAGFEQVNTTTDQGADGGIDIVILHKGKKIAVQCKRYHPTKHYVNIQEVRALMGSSLQEHCQYSIFVTTSFFTKITMSSTDDTKVAKINGETLEEWSKGLWKGKQSNKGALRFLSPLYIESLPT